MCSSKMVCRGDSSLNILSDKWGSSLCIHLWLNERMGVSHLPLLIKCEGDNDNNFICTSILYIPSDSWRLFLMLTFVFECSQGGQPRTTYYHKSVCLFLYIGVAEPFCVWFSLLCVEAHGPFYISSGMDGPISNGSNPLYGEPKI